jgi:cobalamin biosynthesis protein CobD/CbiB
MPAAAIVTLVLAAILVLALAFYLTWVILLLHKIEDTLGKVTFGVRAIAHRTGPINPAVQEMNGNLHAVAEALEGIVAKATDRTPVP